LAALASAAAGHIIANQHDVSRKKNLKKVFLAPTKTRPELPASVPKNIPVPVVMVKKQPQVFGPSAYKLGPRRKIRKKRRQNTMITAPVARGTSYFNAPPNLTGNGHRLVISHCEPFIAVNMTAAGVLNYATSPIIPAALNYLTGIAQNFSKYSWKRLSLHYVPSCPTNADGEMAFGTYFDRQDALAATFVQVSQMTGGVSTPPWGGGPFAGPGAVRIDIDCARFDKPRYSFLGTTPFAALSTSDQNNYCPVSMARATQGNTVGGSIMGRVWLSYTVELMDPIPSGLNV
jgi:hypothetical protein